MPCPRAYARRLEFTSAPWQLQMLRQSSKWAEVWKETIDSLDPAVRHYLPGQTLEPARPNSESTSKLMRTLVTGSWSDAVPERRIAWRNHGGPVIAKYELHGGSPGRVGHRRPHLGR